MEINNIPEYAKKYKFIVAKLVDGEYWFLSAHNELEKAQKFSSNQLEYSTLVIRLSEVEWWQNLKKNFIRLLG